MTIIGLVLTGLAAVLHIFIFYLESIAWTSPRARATFGTTESEAEASKSLAFNQGFYNLFLALAVVIGIIASALKQGTLPLLGVLSLLIGVLI